MSRASAAFVAAVAVAGACPAFAAGGPSKPALPAEWKYVDEKDDAAAAKLLEPLLKRYDAPKKCEDLVRLLRGKRPLPTGLSEQGTVPYASLDGKPRSFSWVLPKKPSGKPSGLLVFLHGAVRQPAPGGGLGEATRIAMPGVEALSFAVVAPSTYEGVEWGSPACRDLVHAAVSWAKRNLYVDDNRVYLAGDSDGGRGTYAVLEQEATTFAAAVPVIGSPAEVRLAANLRNVPILAWNGDQDTIFTIDHVRSAVDALESAGVDVAWKVLEGVGHDPFLFVKKKEEIDEFLVKHPRDPWPKVVHLEVATDAAPTFPGNTVRWLRIDETGSTEHDATFEDTGALSSGTARVKATREGNLVTIESRGVKAMSVLVSDAAFDLGKEIEVRANGSTVFRGRVEPDAKTILEEARRLQDHALVIQARIAVRLDAVAGDSR